MTDFLGHPGFTLLLALGLAPDDFAVAGSGPLFARGWIDDIGDVDVVARGEAWDAAAKLGPIDVAPFAPVARISLFDGAIEILDGWFPEIWNVDDLIDGADVIQGIRFVRLDVIHASKEILRRPRDLVHLRVLRDHL